MALVDLQRRIWPRGDGDMSAARTKGAYRRLKGVLRMAGRSALLESEQGAIVRLVWPEDLAHLDGAQVITEGNWTEPDRLQVEWIGRPSTRLIDWA